ncbi:hypothetical protein LPB03_12205 [Polaribacter vadi]|uniref:Uncharacterized protein n=1 Tax=Polaribacter vadi TaxID=1774273 RepID=A0A1B8TTP2_9FLAO|nr:hypothetical protein [Polaribacter vadi]AOW18166.1 hypothetical protein LPB03_12205 [Polaribacter vadi]OBY62898.1 hypothetical protein LPB3_12220 [Polaribacter vadi]|tara:strand:- start:102 stop:749 length:648 start_codon:yes stop_codon:yes gene_type:complete
MKTLRILFLISLFFVINSCTSPSNEEVTPISPISLSNEGLAGTYAIPGISIQFNDRTTLSNPIFNNWYTAIETDIKSEGKDVDLNIVFNPDKTYSIFGSFVLKSDYSFKNYVDDSESERKEYEQNNIINSSGTYEVYKDATLNSIPKKGKLVLSPGFSFNTHDDILLDPFFETERTEWYVEILQGNYMKLSNWNFDFGHRWSAEQTISLDVIKEN